jgi:hypothetical protein
MLILGVSAFHGSGEESLLGLAVRLMYLLPQQAGLSGLKSKSPVKLVGGQHKPDGSMIEAYWLTNLSPQRVSTRSCTIHFAGVWNYLAKLEKVRSSV